MMAGCLVYQVMVLLLASWKSAATPCNSSQILVPTRVGDTESAYRLAEAVDCSGGSFDVEWVGSVRMETAIRVTDGTTLRVTGASDGSSFIDGSNETSLFYVIGGTLHLSQLTMANGTAEFGGSINATDSVVTTSNCTFVGNEAGYGGAVHLFDSTFEATNSTFVGNLAAVDGGAITSIASNVTVAQGGRFEDNDAYYGGAIYSEGSSIHVIDSASFLGNTAFVGGGAFLWASEFEVNKTTYAGNNATGYGGSICAGNSNVTIANGARFLNNSATEQGGAIMVYENCSLLLSDVVEFEENFANFGGALFVEVSVLYMDGFTSFTNNIADDSGGAVYGVLSDITITDNALWETNNAIYGAGIRLYRFCTLTVTGSVAFLNNSGFQGPGMWVSERSNVIISGPSTFESNFARHDGGGLVVYNSTMQFTNGSTTSFYNNSCAQAGGAILLYTAGEITVAGNATFANNSAELGAGIAASEGTSVTVTGNVVMENNFASSAGGAIYLDAPHQVLINGTRFFYNQAMQSGGAIVAFSAGTGDEYATISHCVFEHNMASDAGGALFIGGGFILINTSRLFSNIAGE